MCRITASGQLDVADSRWCHNQFGDTIVHASVHRVHICYLGGESVTHWVGRSHPHYQHWHVME